MFQELQHNFTNTLSLELIFSLYRVLVLHQVPQQRAALLADVVQVDVIHGMAAGVLVFMDGRACRDQTDQTFSGYRSIQNGDQ